MVLSVGYLLAEYGGITHQRLQDDSHKYQELLEKFALEFEPDIVTGLFNSPEVSRALGDRMTRWPGLGLPETGVFQFAEAEFTKQDDYDAFIGDPSDWAVRKYLRRTFSKLEGLSELPPLGMFAPGSTPHENSGCISYW